MSDSTGIVLSREGGSFRVATPGGEVTAILRGKARRDRYDRIVVGDRVTLDAGDAKGTFGIAGVAPRRNLLERRTPSGRANRPIAANLDRVFVVTAAAEPRPVPQILDRLLVIAEVNDIPAALSDGALGRSRLLARAATGTGAPGTIFAGQGAGGTDAVAGANGGQANASGAYQVSENEVVLTKSATVSGVSGGTAAVPGARITYQIVVNVSGSAPAANFVFTDAIPAGTTFASGSLLLNGVALTDAADADAGEFQGGATASVRVALGDLTQAAGPQTVAFTVTIN